MKARIESLRCCSRAKKNYEIKNPIARQITAPTTSKPGPWTDESIRHAPLEDPDMKPITESKKSSRTFLPSDQIISVIERYCTIFILETACLAGNYSPIMGEA